VFRQLTSDTIRYDTERAKLQTGRPTQLVIQYPTNMQHKKYDNKKIAQAPNTTDRHIVEVIFKNCTKYLSASNVIAADEVRVHLSYPSVYINAAIVTVSFLVVFFK